MTNMTDEEARAARASLAAYEAEKAEEARTAENARRAAAREAFKPLAEAMPDLTAAADQVRAAVEDGLAAERGLADLARNVLIVIDSLKARLERRVADTEPVPEAPPPPALPTD